ncbi:hypothetical protein N9W07_00615 [Alphaproteobacteria bacterium]|nr:hypothetical protein [Alphaproteobacteria bacterium]
MVEASDFTTRIKIEDESRNIMHSCCGGVSDKRLITILAQVCFSGVVLVFSATMLGLERGEPSIYLSLVTSVLSYWLGKNESLK